MSHGKRRKRLRLVPIILGAYALLLGLGLVAAGLAGSGEGAAPEAVGTIRILMGIAMACFGLYGIWDGVRDLIRTDKKPEVSPASQFIFTDVEGKKSSNVTIGQLQAQIDRLIEMESNASFEVQILPPVSIPEQGMLKKAACVYLDAIVLLAFIEGAGDRCWLCREFAERDQAEEWLKRFLDGVPDVAGWEKTEIWDAYRSREGGYPEEMQAYGKEFLERQGGVRAFWNQLLVIFGESWHDEHRFFSDRDLELAAEGVGEGKYKKVVLEWGFSGFDILSGRDNELLVIWRINGLGNGQARFFAREGTVTQVKFWLVRYLEGDMPGDISGWTEITGQNAHI